MFLPPIPSPPWLILQTLTRPYPQITFRTRPDPPQIDTESARPGPEGRFDTLDGTQGNETIWYLA